MILQFWMLLMRQFHLLSSTGLSMMLPYLQSAVHDGSLRQVNNGVYTTFILQGKNIQHGEQMLRSKKLPYFFKPLHHCEHSVLSLACGTNDSSLPQCSSRVAEPTLTSNVARTANYPA